MAATGLLAILAPVPLLVPGGILGAPWDYPVVILDAITVSLAAAALAAFLELWRGRLPAAILASTLYGVFAGTEYAVAVFLTPYGGSTLAAAPFGLLVLPAAAATYLLLKEWLRTLALATSASPGAVRMAVRHMVTIYSAYAALEALGFLAVFLLYAAPCPGASGSQTACSSQQESATLGTIGMVFVVPIVVTFSLGQVLEHRRNALFRSAGPPPTGP